MLRSLITSALLVQASLVSAFPDIRARLAAQKLEDNELIEGARRHLEARQVPAVAPFPEWPGLPTHALYNKFDPVKQLVNISKGSGHEFIAPGPNDIRGPCAGLNAAANHGFLPRDGIATFESINTGLWEAFGLDQTATLFLQTATVFFNGDPLSGRWSIGPHSPKTNSLGALGDALGNQTGICAYGHLKTEADASITRGDWLAPDENLNCISYPKFLQQLFDLADEMAGGFITPRVMAEHGYRRKLYSIATNPNYFSPPYAGVAFTFGAHMFAFQLLANHSAEHPRGIMTKETFMDFFGYTRDDAGALKFTFGSERFPENWYKRADDDAWTLSDIGASTAQQCAAYPGACQVGGNTGTVNSFTGVNLADVTGGFIDGIPNLMDPNKMGCFIRQNIQAEVPAFLSKVANGVLLGQLLGMVQTKLIPALAGWGACEGLPEGRTIAEYGSSYPGARFEDSGPRGAYA